MATCPSTWQLYSQPTSGPYNLPYNIDFATDEIHAIYWEHWTHAWWPDGSPNQWFIAAVTQGVVSGQPPNSVPWMKPDAISYFTPLGGMYQGSWVGIPIPSNALWSWGMPQWFVNALAQIDPSGDNLEASAHQSDPGWKLRVLTAMQPLAPGTPPPPPPPGTPWTPISPASPGTTPWHSLSPPGSHPDGPGPQKPSQWQPLDLLPFVAFGAAGLGAYALGKKL